MRYKIFDDMTQCSELEVARMLPLVSEQRRQQALSYKHLFGQYCCLKSYEMLMELLASTSCTPHHTPLFNYNEYGQPSLDGGPYFSISHSKHAIAVAISNNPIGIDVEAVRNVQASLVEKTMNAEERSLIADSENMNLAFTRLWTKKEAYLKMKGTGIIADLKTTLEDMDPTKVVIDTLEYIDKGYVLSLAHASVDTDSLS